MCFKCYKYDSDQISECTRDIPQCSECGAEKNYREYRNKIKQCQLREHPPDGGHGLSREENNRDKMTTERKKLE